MESLFSGRTVVALLLLAAVFAAWRHIRGPLPPAPPSSEQDPTDAKE